MKVLDGGTVDTAEEANVRSSTIHAQVRDAMAAAIEHAAERFGDIAA